MTQRYAVIFPAAAAAGYGGTHWFSTQRERSAFMARAVERGVDTKAAKLTEHQKPQRRSR